MKDELNGLVMNEVLILSTILLNLKFIKLLKSFVKRVSHYLIYLFAACKR